MQLFVVAKDEITRKPLGLIQFLVTPEYAYGSVKAAFYGVESTAQHRGLEKLLMGSVFNVIPTVKKIFLPTRVTNENAINMYRSWGFAQFSGPLANWIDLEYITAQADTLQKNT